MLANLSFSDSQLILDYESFVLLSTFFGWDSSLNQAHVGTKTLTEWLQDAPSGSSHPSVSVESSRSSPKGKTTRSDSLFGPSSSEDNSISSHVLSNLDADADPEPENETGVPATTDFVDAPILGLESQEQESRTFLFSFAYLFI